MINLTTTESSIIFEFTDSKHYLTGTGTIEVPKSSLTLVTDDSDMATFRKSASNDIFVSAPYSEFGKSKEELISWFEENGFSDGGSGGVTPKEVEEMIDEAIATKADTFTVKSPLTYENNQIGVNGNSVVTMVNSAHLTSGITQLVTTINNGSQAVSMAVGSINGERIAAVHEDYVKDFQLATKQELEDAERVTAEAFVEINNKLDNTYTKAEVDDAIEDAIGDIDLSNYVDVPTFNNKELATAQALTDLNETKADKTEIPDMDGYVTTDKFNLLKATVHDQSLNKADITYVNNAIDNVEQTIEDNELVTAQAFVSINNRLGGLKLQKITQSDYDALATKDNNTLYIITSNV